MQRMRARRAAGLAPAEDREPLDPDDLLLPAVEATIAALGLAAEDAGAAEVARRYAGAMDSARDQAWAARWLGPLLLKALEELRATPRSRQPPPRGRGKSGTVTVVR
jgi:hypothetical protein